MRRSRTSSFAAAATMVVLTAISMPAGATTTYTLSINDNGSGGVSLGSFALYGEVTGAGGGAGLASFGADLQNYSTLSNQSPSATYFNASGSPPIKNGG